MTAQTQLDIRGMLLTLTGKRQRDFLLLAALAQAPEHYGPLLEAVLKHWQETPETYESDGKGRAALARIHFHLGAADWWIVEKDIDTDGEGQIQAFGVADLGMGCRELGYISIPEILEAGAELDLYYSPATVGEIMGRSVA